MLRELQTALQHRLSRQGLSGKGEHGGGAIHPQHRGGGMTPRQQQADVAGSATEIDQPRTQAGGEALLQPIDQGLVTGAEVGGGVGERLQGVVHQLRFGNAIHGEAAGQEPV